MDSDFYIGPWLVQPGLNTVSAQTDSIRLEPKVMQVLTCLAEHAGEVVPKERLMHAVWADTFVTEDVLTRAISALRRVFCDNAKAPRIIETLPKTGYRLIAAISPALPRSLRITTLLVLPFANGSGDPEANYLSDGITDCLINALSLFPHLKVVARSTAFRFKGTDRVPVAIGRELGVNAVVTGKVTQWDGKISVQADLVNATTGFQIWGQRWIRPLGNLLSLPEELVRDISENLKVQVNGEQQKRLGHQPTAKPEAYHLYLKARYLWHQGTEESIRKARQLFEEAVRCDPGYALAYAGLADCHSALACQLDYAAVPPRDAAPLAGAAAHRALELDGKLAAGHSALASVLRDYHWDWGSAEREFRTAIALNPNYPKAHQSYADLLVALSRFDEALAQIEAAHEMDPFSVTINHDMGFILYLARDYEQAAKRLRLTAELRPDYIPARTLLSFVLERTGRPREASEEYDRALALSQGKEVPMAALGRVYSAGGRDQLLGGLEQLRSMASHRYVPACWFAAVYTRLGEGHLALDWMEKAEEERSNWLIYLRADPLFDGLRSEPRFEQLAGRVGLPSPRITHT